MVYKDRIIKGYAIYYFFMCIYVGFADQPQVRPIVRGKTNPYVEFGAKINVSLMNGFVFLDDYSLEAFNEGTRLMATVEKFKQRSGYYPKEVLADTI